MAASAPPRARALARHAHPPELPETLGLEGEPPPTDDREAGGGTETQVIE
jgi:hypothetical protein